MRTRLGPCFCQGCGVTLYWTGNQWTENRRGSDPHYCPGVREVCGVFMRQARERCALGFGHLGCHRTAYALENARLARTGRAA